MTEERSGEVKRGRSVGLGVCVCIRGRKGVGGYDEQDWKVKNLKCTRRLYMKLGDLTFTHIG